MLRRKLRAPPRRMIITISSTLGAASLLTGIYGTTVLVKTISAVTGLASMGTGLALMFVLFHNRLVSSSPILKGSCLCLVALQKIAPLRRLISNYCLYLVL